MSGRKSPQRKEQIDRLKPKARLKYLWKKRKSSLTKKQVNTGNSYVEGSANLKSGDFVGGNKNVGLSPDNVIELINTIGKNLAPSYRDPILLDDALQKFQSYHHALHEWKELHNAIHNIKIAFDQYDEQVNRIKSKQVTPSLTNLRLLWKPVSRAINGCIDFSKTIKIIGVPFKEHDGQLQGERWSVEIVASRNDLEKILNQENTAHLSIFTFNITSIIGAKPKWWHNFLDLNGDFKSTVDYHLDWCDKNLREAATNLYNLSEIVFRRQ
jgi:hypothetical protein